VVWFCKFLRVEFGGGGSGGLGRGKAAGSGSQYVALSSVELEGSEGVLELKV
jgi:hypothetical protein